MISDSARRLGLGRGLGLGFTPVVSVVFIGFMGILRGGDGIIGGGEKLRGIYMVEL